MNNFGLSIDDQIRLLHKKPGREEILNQDFKSRKNLTINVFRNEAVEPTLNLASRFLSNFNFQVTWNYGPYDDTLLLKDFVNRDADANLVWLDWRRLQKSQLNSIIQILSDFEIETGVIKNFVLEPFEGDLKNFSEVTIALSKLKNIMPIKILDELAPELTRDPRLINRNGTDLSNAASFAIAQVLGLQVIPELALPVLKCLVIDLDNTLYSGVLGEDGTKGIVVSEAHKALGIELKRLKSQGIFLAIASKNEIEDVLELFKLRTDLPLNISDVSVVKANWGMKSNSIVEIANDLNIGTDSIAFLDDNPMELSEVSNAIKDIYAIYAPTPEVAVRNLKFGPRTSAFIRDSTEGIRAKDAMARSRRNRLIEDVADQVKIHEILETSLQIQTGVEVDLDRAQDLFQRTNQFNVGLNRTKIDKLNIQGGEEFVSSASLMDKYSDSGVIAALHGTTLPIGIFIDEFVISCRALGRSLETIIFTQMLNRLAINGIIDKETIYLEWKIGPRNIPSLNWLKKELGFILDGNKGTIKINLSSIPTNLKLLKQIHKEQYFD